MLNWKLVAIVVMIWIALVAVTTGLVGERANDGGQNQSMKEWQAGF